MESDQIGEVGNIENNISKKIEEIRGSKRQLSPLTPEDMNIVRGNVANECHIIETPKGSMMTNKRRPNPKTLNFQTPEIFNKEADAIQALVSMQEETVVCGGCEESIGKTDLDIKCDICDIKWHINCTKIKEEDYCKVKSLEGKIRWFCPRCDKNFKNLLRENERLREAVKIMNKSSTNESLKIQQNDIDMPETEKQEFNYDINLKNEIINEIKDELQNTIKSVYDKIESDMIKINRNNDYLIELFNSFEEKFDYIKEIDTEAISMISKNVTDTTRQIIEDNSRVRKPVQQKNIQERKSEEEKERKKNNLVIYNVTESGQNEVGKRIEDDIMICEEILSELEVGNVFIEKVVRLGKNDNSKIRPVLMRLRNEKEKWNILGRAKQLKNSEKYKGVYITRDMTEKEREEDKILRTELKERRDNGEDVQIKNGVVVKRRKNITLGEYVMEQKTVRNSRGLRGRKETMSEKTEASRNAPN